MTFIMAVLAVLALGRGAAAAPECAVPESLFAGDSDLARVAAAVRERGRLDISVVGTASSSLSGPDGARRAYPARLEVALRELLPGAEIKVTAHAEPRRTAAELAAELPKILADDKPALVIWQTGTVDALHGIEPDEFRTSLDDGVAAIEAAGADVVVMNMQYSPRTESILGVAAYADAMHWVAEQRGALLFDRLAIMRHWTDAGIFDLYATTKDYAMAQHVHDCIGRALASQIINSAHLDAGKTQTTR